MNRTIEVKLNIDADNWQRMLEVCDELGLSADTALNIFIKKVSRESRIPFDIAVDPFYSESNMRYLKGIVRDMENGTAHFTEHELIEVE